MIDSINKLKEVKQRADENSNNQTPVQRIKVRRYRLQDVELVLLRSFLIIHLGLKLASIIYTDYIVKLSPLGFT